MSAAHLARRLRPLTWTVAVLGIAALIAWQVGAWRPSASDTTGGDSASADNVNVGLKVYPPGSRADVPALEGTTLTGESFALSGWAGKIVVVNVWGSWCGPCRTETPDLVRVARRYAADGVRFVGIDTRDNRDSAKAFTAKFKVPYPSIFDDDGQAVLQFGQVIPTAVVPSTVVVDRQGKVAVRVIGPVTYNTLSGVLDDELARGGQ